MQKNFNKKNFYIKVKIMSVKNPKWLILLA